MIGARPVAGAAQGVRARRRRARRGAGARLPAGGRPRAVPRGDPRRSRRTRSGRDAGRDRGLQAARRRVRQRRPAAVPRHPRALPGVAAPRRWRRRRREPQGLPDRGEPGADDPQRRRQPDAVSGGLGRRPHQALADLQRRAVAQLRAHLRAGAPLRVRRLQPAGAARRPRGRGGHPVRGADRLRRADALLRSRARSSGAACGRSRTSRCRRSRSGASSTARSTRTRCARSSARRRGRRRIAAASSACTGSSGERRDASAVYPAGRAARDRFVLDRRGPRHAVRSLGAAPRHHRSRARRPTAASSTSPRCSSPAASARGAA